MTNKSLGVLGATSFVGERVLSLLKGSDWQVSAFSRQQHDGLSNGVDWFDLSVDKGGTPSIEYWLSVAPLWVLPDYFTYLEHHPVKRVVVLSSTSRFTKNYSSNLEEQAFVARLVDAEERLQQWAESKGIDWIILRPTLIYDFGRDKNISEIACFINRFRFFPLFGDAKGLRQPIHAEDVAFACLAALNKLEIKNKAYNISGSETITYREMVLRIFKGLNRQPRLFKVPLSVFRIAVACLKLLPRYRHLTTAMAERMNQDMVFDHGNASTDLNFKPRKFILSKMDLPR